MPLNANTATALLFGIKSDTAEMSRGVSALDIEMYYQLYKLADHRKINKIQMNTIEFHELVGFGEALRNVRVFDSIGFARIDAACPDGLIAAVSDFILSLVEIDRAVVYAVRNDGVRFSVRSELEWADAGKAVSAALAGLGSGGGHSSMAGGFIPSANVPESLDDVVRERFLAVFAATDKLKPRG
jgi:nanoRNase/pAp phosphatase (c-di-AMP/oligoRNAs hydrolase)